MVCELELALVVALNSPAQLEFSLFPQRPPAEPDNRILHHPILPQLPQCPSVYLVAFAMDVHDSSLPSVPRGRLGIVIWIAYHVQ